MPWDYPAGTKTDSARGKSLKRAGVLVVISPSVLIASDGSVRISRGPGLQNARIPTRLRLRPRRNAVRKSANPASMAAAMALLNATPVAGEGRRIAVLGDMLELGSQSAKLHAALAELIVGTQTHNVFLGGPEMQVLADVLPAEVKTEYRAGAEELKPILLSALRPGDVVMVKSSKGIGFSKLVEALLGKFPAEATTIEPT